MTDMSVPADSRPSDQRHWKHLKFAALSALLLHAIAGLSMALVLRQGLDTAPDITQRLEFLANYRLVWVSAWITWNCAALSILNFFYRMAKAHARDLQAQTKLLNLAVLICVGAVAADLFAEAVEMSLIPEMARSILRAPDSKLEATIDDLLYVHRLATISTGYFGNGLYTISTALTVWSTRFSYGRLTTIAGCCAVAGGIWLSIAALTDSVSGMVLSNILLMPSLLIWLTTIALKSTQRASNHGLERVSQSDERV